MEPQGLTFLTRDASRSRPPRGTEAKIFGRDAQWTGALPSLSPHPVLSHLNPVAVSLPASPHPPLNRKADLSFLGAPWSLSLPFVLIPSLKQTLAQRLSKFIHCVPKRQWLRLE